MHHRGKAERQKDIFEILRSLPRGSDEHSGPSAYQLQSQIARITISNPSRKVKNMYLIVL